MPAFRGRGVVTGLLPAGAEGGGILRFYAAAERAGLVGEHSLAVACYALTLAGAMAVQEGEFLRDLEMGALLHDIGKAGIPGRILDKRGPLTVSERMVMREHPLLGYGLISRFESLRGAGRIVLFHHERFDGRGYPFGLTGTSIPLTARIFSLADALDAMTSDRPYRTGRAFREARLEITRCRGTQFDPDVVDAFQSVPDHAWSSSARLIWPAQESDLIH